MFDLLRWYLILLLFAAATLPLGWTWFRHLPDRGWGSYRALGLLLAGFAIWFAGSLGLLADVDWAGVRAARRANHEHLRARIEAADLPMTETVVALSALLGGVAVLLKRSAPAMIVAALFGVIGLFHGCRSACQRPRLAKTAARRLSP